jgi:RecG-like helicase
MEHSINGCPWTKAKMQKAISDLKQDGNLTFALGYEKLSLLKEINDIVFQKRPDLILHVWSTDNNNNIITDTELECLSAMGNVKKLQLNGFKNKELNILSNMVWLNYISIVANKFDLSFIKELKELKEIRLTGKFNTLEYLQSCTELKFIYLSTTIDSFDFFSTVKQYQNNIYRQLYSQR